MLTLNIFHIFFSGFIVDSKHLHCSGVFIVDFKQILHLFLVFQLLTLNKRMLAGFRLAIRIASF